jgi:predicted secreted protein
MTVVAMGTTLKKGTTAIASLTSIDGVSVSADTIETTALDTIGGYRTFVTSLKDSGEISISGHFSTTAHKPLFDDFEDGIASSYTIEFPDGTTWGFSAVVTAFGTSAELEDLISFESTLKISGPPILTPPV